MPEARLRTALDGVPRVLKIRDEIFHIGGEGNVHLTEDDAYVVKLYTKKTMKKEFVKYLETIIGLQTILGPAERYFAWPVGIVESLDGRPRLGVVTRKVPDTYKPLSHLMMTATEAKQYLGKGANVHTYLKLARSTAIALSTIHHKGLAHADIHLQNFLADPASGEAVLIDLDGLVLPAHTRPQVKGMLWFMAPEVVMGKANPNEKTDLHSIAVLILWILLFRNVMQPQKCYSVESEAKDDELGYGREACFSEHPTDSRNHVPDDKRQCFLSYKILSPELRSLAERALITGLHDPDKRPLVKEWEEALAKAYDLLYPCKNPQCRLAFLYPFKTNPKARCCPFCGEGTQTQPVAILDLLERSASGSQATVRNVVLHEKQTLYADLAEPGMLPPFSRKGTPELAKTQWDASARVLKLVNLGSLTWTILMGGDGEVPPGTAVAVHKGMMISFGDRKRAVRVIE